MDTALIIVLLGIALLAIVAVPSLLRRKNEDSSGAPSADSAHVNTPAPRPASMVSLDETQSQWFARWLCEQASAQTGIDLARDPMALMRIGEAATKVQAEVDASGHAEISLPYIAANASGPKHFNLKVTREQLANARNLLAQ